MLAGSSFETDCSAILLRMRLGKRKAKRWIPGTSPGMTNEEDYGERSGLLTYSPMARRFALPPAAAVLIVTVCSVAKRRR